MKTFNRTMIGLLVLVAFAFSSLVITAPAYASKKGRQNTATALTAAALYELLRGHTTTGLILGGGSYYAWKQANKGKKHHRYSSRHHHRNYAYRNDDYRYGGQYSHR